MHAQLAAVVADLETASARVRRLQAWLPSSGWSARPAPGRWSAAECVAHLNLTSGALLPLLHTALRHARHRDRPAPSRYRRGAMGWLVSQIIAPSGGVKTATIAAFEPSAVQPIDAVVGEFARFQAEIITCVHDADGLPLERVRVRSPFDGRVSVNLYAALTLVPRHQHRHLHQAEQAAQAHAPAAAAAV